MIAPKRRLTNHALHGREEWFKRIFRDQIAEAAGILEVVLSGIVLAALLMSIVPLVELMPGLLTDADSLETAPFGTCGWTSSLASSLSRCWPSTAPAAPGSAALRHCPATWWSATNRLWTTSSAWVPLR